MLNKNRPYSRIEINKVFTKVKAAMHAKAILRGEKIGLDKAVYQDVYTGKQLFGGDKYDYEHIRSAEDVFNTYKSTFTDQQIALIVNCPENVAVTLSSLNNSKGKKRMEIWLKEEGNIELYGLDIKLTKSVLKKADIGIKRKANEL